MLDGGFLTAKHAAPHLARTGGTIIMIEGGTAFTGANSPAVPTAKAGLVGLVRSLAVALGQLRRIGEAVGHDDKPAVGTGEPPVALALQVRDRDRAGGQPPAQQDLRRPPQPVGRVGGQVLDLVQRRHQRHRDAARQPGGQGCGE